MQSFLKKNHLKLGVSNNSIAVLAVGASSEELNEHQQTEALCYQVN